ncbi:MAG: hypothetical protein GY705_20785 [Bacteroidetes bacterium]|nr:hypothetical protein [Bacteroidota bacterium]
MYLSDFNTQESNATKKLLEFSYCYLNDIGLKKGRQPIKGIVFVNSLKDMKGFLWNHDRINWARLNKKHTLLSCFVYRPNDTTNLEPSAYLSFRSVKYYNKGLKKLKLSGDLLFEIINTDCTSKIGKEYMELPCPKGYYCPN